MFVHERVEANEFRSFQRQGKIYLVKWSRKGFPSLALKCIQGLWKILFTSRAVPLMQSKVGNIKFFIVSSGRYCALLVARETKL